MKKTRKPIVVAIIPARAGSKGLRGKNIYPVRGHPMIAWTIRAALDCHQVSHAFVISDGRDIRNVAERYGARVIAEPAKLGGDNVSYRPVLEYAVRHIIAEGIRPDIIVYMQPTSPQRDHRDLAKALRLLRGAVHAVISVYKVDNKFLKSFVVRKGVLSSLSRDPWPFMVRHELPTTYMPNGAIFAIRTNAYRKIGGLFAPRTLPYLMPTERSIDVDYLHQIHEVATYMRKAGRKLPNPRGVVK